MRMLGRDEASGCGLNGGGVGVDGGGGDGGRVVSREAYVRMCLYVRKGMKE